DLRRKQITPRNPRRRPRPNRDQEPSTDYADDTDSKALTRAVDRKSTGSGKTPSFLVVCYFIGVICVICGLRFFRCALSRSENRRPVPRILNAYLMSLAKHLRCRS